MWKLFCKWIILKFYQFYGFVFRLFCLTGQQWLITRKSVFSSVKSAQNRFYTNLNLQNIKLVINKYVSWCYESHSFPLCSETELPLQQSTIWMHNKLFFIKISYQKNKTNICFLICCILHKDELFEPFAVGCTIVCTQDAVCYYYPAAILRVLLPTELSCTWHTDQTAPLPWGEECTFT